MAYGIGATVLELFLQAPSRIGAFFVSAAKGDAWRGIYQFFGNLLSWLVSFVLELPANLLKWGCTIPSGPDYIALCFAPGPWLLIARAMKADVTKLGLALHGAKFYGIVSWPPPSPHTRHTRSPPPFLAAPLFAE